MSVLHQATAGRVVAEVEWSADLVAAVRDWIAADPDAETRAELDDLLERADGGDQAARDDLVDRFRSPLAFGTAGLRGEMGGGPNRMNLAVVVRTAAGIAAWLDGRVDPSGAVVVGYDGRHHSSEWALAMAEVLAGAGRRALLLPEPLPTPVLAFAVRHLGAVAGLMVTASHNRATDNGCKVYDGSGRQIVAPVDAEIASAIAAVGPAASVPRPGPQDPDVVRLDDRLVAAYVDGAARVGRVPGARDVVIAHSALHGVATATFRRVLAAGGFAAPVEVPEQADPDPDFPTVAYPNPEDAQAVVRGRAVAAAAQADVLVVHDPDADRVRIAVPLPPGRDDVAPDGWRGLGGDQLGAVLAHHLLRHGGFAPDEVVATTIVSSSLLAAMAREAGVECVVTLTGFKWLARAGEATGRRVGYAYEEALGYCVGELVRDKDGLTAGLLAAEAVAALATEGRTVLDVLDELEVAHGVHHVSGAFIPVARSGTGSAEAAMARLRSHPPTEVGGSPVLAVEDLADPGGPLPVSDVVVLRLDGGRVVIRPSGTEPNLKTYVEVVEPVGSPDELAAARRRAAAVASRWNDALLARLRPSGPTEAPGRLD